MAITAKTHPWRINLLRPVQTWIGALVIETVRTSERTEIAPGYYLPQSAGERCYRSRKDALASCAAFRAEHGANVCTDPYKAAGAP